MERIEEKIIANEILETIKENVGEFYQIIPSVNKTDNKVILNFKITTKMMEITEICVFELTENISIEDIEKMSDQCYHEELAEINEKYAFKPTIIKTNKFTIKMTPIQCDGDYCDVGGELEIEIYDLELSEISELQKAVETIIYLS